MKPIDEAFRPFHEIVAGMLAFAGEVYDDDAGVRSRIYSCEIESPVELDVVVDDGGGVRIGSAPPLYRVQTTILPSFHHVRFRAELTERAGDEHGE